MRFMVVKVNIWELKEIFRWRFYEVLDSYVSMWYLEGEKRGKNYDI